VFPIRKDVVMVPSRITEMQQGHDGYKQVQTKFKDFKRVVQMVVVQDNVVRSPLLPSKYIYFV